jgi:AraC-like DNA-binding protein
MRETLRGADPDRLERSCIRLGARAPGLEWAEAHFTGRGFEPHRHDTYAIGVTLHGVQGFRYRGARRICLPGQLHVLHPDELHDGGPATDAGFGYQIVYVAPELVSAAVGTLPFVAEPVHHAPPELLELLRDPGEVDELRAASVATVLADTLRALAGNARDTRVDAAAVERAREYVHAHAREPIAAATLERVAGLDRFALARQFRAVHGTSPDRYRTLRRLARARAAIEAGATLVEAAAESGFADQSHLTRQFKRAYGLTPARWAAAVAAGTMSGAGG